MMVLCDGLLDQIDSQSELVRSFTNQQKSQLLSQRQQLTEFLEVQQAYDTVSQFLNPYFELCLVSLSFLFLSTIICNFLIQLWPAAS